MKLSTASAILCTALLASFCNAFPYLDYWDREAFLEQLQQEERVGTDINARVKPGNCTLISCDVHPGTILFVSHDREKSFQRSPTPSINTCTDNYDPNDILICFFQCPVLNISNGEVEYDHGIDNQLQPRDPDTNATYSCNENYALRGNMTRTCGRNRTWLGEDPECVLQCPGLQDIANGLVSITGREPGARAIYSCNSGYILQGTEIRTCGQNAPGQWSGQEPSCVPLCPELQDIPNGTVSYTSRKPGATANYSCNSDYTLEGTRMRTCGQNAPGQWSGQEPTCEPKPEPTKGPFPPERCPKLNESDIPNNVPEVRSKLWNHPNREYLLFTPYYKRRIEGDRFKGSKAYLTCMPMPPEIIGDGWKLLEGTPSEQTCVQRNGELVWTRAGTCVYSYSVTRPWPSYG